MVYMLALNSVAAASVSFRLLRWRRVDLDGALAYRASPRDVYEPRVDASFLLVLEGRKPEVSKHSIALAQGNGDLHGRRDGSSADEVAVVLRLHHQA